MERKSDRRERRKERETFGRREEREMPLKFKVNDMCLTDQHTHTHFWNLQIHTHIGLVYFRECLFLCHRPDYL